MIQARVVLLAVLGTLVGATVLAAGFRMSVAGTYGGREVIWAGIVLLVASYAFTVQRPNLVPAQMRWLLGVLAVGLFLPKLFGAPDDFDYFDELQHVRSTAELLSGSGLWIPNPTNPVLEHYPGLHVVTAAVAYVTGLDVFGAGNIVILAARVGMTFALYSLYRRLTDSTWIAALAVALYAANPSYLYFDAQFSYESLALPLAAGVLALAFAAAKSRRHARMTFIVAVLLEAAIAATHHLTSYALPAILLLFAVCIWLLEPERRSLATRLVALAAAGAALAGSWYAFAAPDTFAYLHGGVSTTVDGIVSFISQQGTRRPFVDSPFHTPPYERVVSLSSVALLGLLFVGGTLSHMRQSPRALRGRWLACVLLGGVYFVSLPLQLSQQATSAVLLPRLWEFSFIGLAPVAAFALKRLADSRWRVGAPVVIVALVAIAITGGSIIRSGDNIRLPGPYIPSSGPRAATPDTLVAARWLEAHYGPRLTVMADNTLANVFGAYARTRPASHQFYGFRPWAVFYKTRFTLAAINELERSKTQFVAIDRRVHARRPFAGWYFSSREPRLNRAMPRAFTTKFGQTPLFRKVYDNGNVVIYRYVGVRAVPRVGLGSRSSVRDGAATLSARCPRRRFTCSARVVLVDADPIGVTIPRTAARSVLGRARLSIRPGETQIVSIPLTDLALAHLREHGSLRAQARVVASGSWAAATRTITDVRLYANAGA